jgi:hypothetical protein
MIGSRASSSAASSSRPKSSGRRPTSPTVVRLDDANTDAFGAGLVDGLDVGTVGNFVQGRAATWFFRARMLCECSRTSGLVLLEQRIYLADGVSQALIVK